jgi:hypothetical protein
MTSVGSSDFARVTEENGMLTRELHRLVPTAIVLSLTLVSTAEASPFPAPGPPSIILLVVGVGGLAAAAWFLRRK